MKVTLKELCDHYREVRCGVSHSQKVEMQKEICDLCTNFFKAQYEICKEFTEHFGYDYSRYTKDKAEATDFSIAQVNEDHVRVKYYLRSGIRMSCISVLKFDEVDNFDPTEYRKEIFEYLEDKLKSQLSDAQEIVNEKKNELRKIREIYKNENINKNQL
jgi:2,3-bisphosphoglycerate-independent phosphoglycerate mutase